MVSEHKLYLLDTNMLSDMMRNPVGLAAQHMRVMRKQSETLDAPPDICTSTIVLCELQFGLRRRTHPRWQTHLDLLLETVEVMPLEPHIAAHYAQLRTQLEAAGTPIGPLDTLIAAHALSLGATLVTADTEFTRVPGLQAENWLQPA